MRLKNILQEALPEKSPIEELREIYEEFHGEELFVSFTKEPKLGINPRSKYDTPLGVYSYPLSYVLERARGNTIDVPFAGDQPYIQVFNQLGNVVVAQEYTENDEQRDYERLIQYYFDYIKESVQHWHAENAEVTGYEKARDIDEFIRQLTEINQEVFLEDAIGAIKTVIDILSASSKMLSEEFSQEPFLSLINEFGNLNIKFKRHGPVDHFNDYPIDLKIELNQLLKTALSVLKEIRDDIRTEFSVEEIYDNAFYFFEEVGEEAFFPTRPFGRLWAVTLQLSRLIEEQDGRKRTVVWNEIFRDALDVHCVIDYGTGIIHKGEPTQAVHFTRETLEHIEQVRNIDYERKNTKSNLKETLSMVSDPELFYRTIAEDDFSPYEQRIIFDRASEVIVENLVNEDFVKEYVDILQEVMPKTFKLNKKSLLNLYNKIDMIFHRRNDLKKFDMDLDYYSKFPFEVNDVLHELMRPLYTILRNDFNEIKVPYIVSKIGYNLYYKIKDYIDTIDEFIERAREGGVNIWSQVYQLRENIEKELKSLDSLGEPRPIIQL